MSCEKNVFKTPHRNDKRSVCQSALPVGASQGDVLSIPASPAMKKLGFGTGVSVFLLERYSPGRGSYGSPWAIKKINSRLNSRSLVDGGTNSSSDGSASPTLYRKQPLSQLWHSRLEDEAKLLRSMNHPNIIGFRGYSTSVDGTKCLVMESGEKDLYSILEQRSENTSDSLPAMHILAVSRGVAKALQYMHEEHHLLHGDIKSANVLIKGNFNQVKLCDFGVCLKLDDKLVMCADQFYVGTECWSPPEVIMEDAPVTDKSDIFALGLTIWECVSLEPPHVHALMSVEGEEQLSPEEQDKLSEDREEQFRKLLGTRPSLPPAAARLTGVYLPLLEAFYHCTSERGEERPSAAALVTLVDEICQELDSKDGTESSESKKCALTCEDESLVTDDERDVITLTDEREVITLTDDEREVITLTDDERDVNTVTDDERDVNTVTEESAVRKVTDDREISSTTDKRPTELLEGGEDTLSTADERKPFSSCDERTVTVESDTRTSDGHSKCRKRKSSDDLNSEDKENCCAIRDGESCDGVVTKKMKMDCKS